MAWQLIETAPKTGVRIWLANPAAEMNDGSTKSRVQLGEWWVDYDMWSVAFDPTHWQPLKVPRAPKAE